jgi:6-pyruvoyltetrahydropterin/6-carboxytetrahydropterin synthase
MARTSLTRRIYFSSAHRYRRVDWTDAENEAVFGACARVNYHGHSYTCDITVAGPVDEETGFVVDLGYFDEVLQREVRARFDHRNINLDVPEFADGKLIPSGENVARFIAHTVQTALAHTSARVTRVVLAEDATLSSTYEPDL